MARRPRAGWRYRCGLWLRGVGLGAIAASHFAGAVTIAVIWTLHLNKLEIAKYSAGATYMVNTARESLHERLMSLTENRGPDVSVIQAIGLPKHFSGAAVEEVAFTGRVVYIGYAKEPVAYETLAVRAKGTGHSGLPQRTSWDFGQVHQDAGGPENFRRASGWNDYSLSRLRAFFSSGSEAPQRFTR